METEDTTTPAVEEKTSEFFMVKTPVVLDGAVISAHTLISDPEKVKQLHETGQADKCVRVTPTLKVDDVK